MQKYFYSNIKLGKQIPLHECSDVTFESCVRYKAILHVHADPQIVGCLTPLAANPSMPLLWFQALWKHKVGDGRDGNAPLSTKDWDVPQVCAQEAMNLTV